MRETKRFKIETDEWDEIQKFYVRIAEYLAEEFGCVAEKALYAIKNAMAFGYAVCDGKDHKIGIQANYARDTIYVGF